MPEKCLKNARKTIDSKIRVFSNPPFYAPTLAIHRAFRSARPATEAPNTGPWKHPKKVPGGPFAKVPGLGKTAEKTTGKTPEAWEKKAVFRLFCCPSGCLSAVFPALYPKPTRLPFRLFFGCFQGPAFGASVAGRADRKSSPRTSPFGLPFRS